MQFNPAAPATKDTPGFVKEPTIKDIIHTVVFVIDGSNVEVMPDEIVKKLKDIKEMLIVRGQEIINTIQNYSLHNFEMCSLSLLVHKKMITF